MTDAQNRVARAVEARGYRDGWSDEQYAARQVAKLTEELAELSSHMRQYGADQIASWEYDLESAGRDARHQFNNQHNWNWVHIRSIDGMAEELADIVVVAFTLADIQGVDISQMAVEKAEKDIKRGVR